MSTEWFNLNTAMNQREKTIQVKVADIKSKKHIYHKHDIDTATLIIILKINKLNIMTVMSVSDTKTTFLRVKL